MPHTPPPQHRCPGCGCNVGPDHVTGSETCREAREERIISQADWE